ncbi:3-alpha-hydroxysteroid sulfotransferase-like isoform X1 [Dermacentor variabilis]|uniref:3-alpha-hydroxysteroid sulfotransferase-like isoform X1 n=1 Tax=Dermacentor variabilis TaxID=34621 RepID=UPI003F5BA893
MPGRRPYRQIIDGVPMCPWIVPETFRKSLKFRAAEEDVVQVTFPKSGTHWVQYITQLILGKAGPATGYNELTQNCRSIEYTDNADWKPAMPMRLFFTHQPLRREVMNAAAKYVYVARNPWDVCVSLFRMITDVSLYQFEDGTFEEFFEPFIEADLGYGSYFDHVAAGYAMKDEPNVFFFTYEELKADTQCTVLKLAHFLGDSYGRALQEDEKRLQNILEWSRPEHMRKTMVVDYKANEVPQWDELFADKKASSKQGYEGDKHKYAVVKEARVGSWKEYFTPELLARFEKKIQEQGHKASFMELWKDIREEAILLSCRSV